MGERRYEENGSRCLRRQHFVGFCSDVGGSSRQAFHRHGREDQWHSVVQSDEYGRASVPGGEIQTSPPWNTAQPRRTLRYS